MNEEDYFHNSQSLKLTFTQILIHILSTDNNGPSYHKICKLEKKSIAHNKEDMGSRFGF